MVENVKCYLIGFLFFVCNNASALELLVPIDELSRYFPDRKCRLTGDDSFFDPLRIDRTRAQVKETVSDEETGYICTIKSSLKEKGIEGIVFGRGAFDGKILIGGQVFSPADELLFINDQGEWLSISQERSVILLSIAKEKGIFLVSGKNADREKGKKEGVKFEILWEDFFKL